MSSLPPLFDNMRDDSPVHRPPTPMRVREAAKQQARDEAEYRSIRRRALSFIFQRSVAVPVDEARRQADTNMRAQRIREAANQSQDRLVAAVRVATAALAAGQMSVLMRSISEAAGAYRDLTLIAVDLQHTGYVADAGRFQQSADFFGSNLQDVLGEAGDDGAGYRHFEDAFVSAAADIEQYRQTAATLNAAHAPTL
jgi:hypothetical protein